MYEEQPRTCAICNAVGHFRSECPTRNKVPVGPSKTGQPPSYALVTERGRGGSEEPRTRGQSEREMEAALNTNEDEGEKRGRDGEEENAAGTVTVAADRTGESTPMTQTVPPAEASAKTLTRTTEKSPARTPVKTPEKTLAKSSAKSPAKTPAQAPGKAAAKVTTEPDTLADTEERETEDSGKEDGGREVPHGDREEVQEWDEAKIRGWRTDDEKNSECDVGSDVDSAGGGGSEKASGSASEGAGEGGAGAKDVNKNSEPSKVDFFKKRSRGNDDRDDRISKLHAQYIRGRQVRKARHK